MSSLPKYAGYNCEEAESWKSKEMARILLVEDEQNLCELVAKWLRSEMHTVDVCGDGAEALHLIQHEQPDMIILDIMLPGMDGLEVCKRFRAAGGNAPILMLTAKRSLSAKEAGLDSGADDYVTKPFKLRELSARVRALLRRQPAMQPAILEVGDLKMDVAANRVFLSGNEIKLVPKEYALLAVLMKNPDRLVRSETLVGSVWGGAKDISPETVRSYIRLLRQKLDAPGPDSRIETVHGLGYRLVSDVQ